MRNKIKSVAAAIFVLTVIVIPMVSLEAAGFTTPTSTGLPSGTITGIITQIMNWLLALVGIIGVIGFAIAGVLYLISAGDDGKIETAKTAMLYSIVGVIVAIMGVVIIKAAQTMLGGTQSTF